MSHRPLAPAGALLVRNVPDRVALRIEVFPALPLEETDTAIEDTVARMDGAEQALVVTTFGVFLLAPPSPVVVGKDGEPLLTMSYGWGPNLGAMDRLLAGTAALWRRAKLPPPATTDDLIFQTFHWVQRLAADPVRALPLTAPGMPGLGAAWMLRLGRQLHRLAIEQLTTDDVFREALLAQHRPRVRANG